MTTTKAQLNELLGDRSSVTGQQPDWQLVQDWTLVGDETSTMEELIARDKKTNIELRMVRMTPAEEERLAAVEQVHEEARTALDDAELPRTADGILWLTAVKEDPSLDNPEVMDQLAILKEMQDLEKRAEQLAMEGDLAGASMLGWVSEEPLPEPLPPLDIPRPTQAEEAAKRAAEVQDRRDSLPVVRPEQAPLTEAEALAGSPVPASGAAAPQQVVAPTPATEAPTSVMRPEQAPPPSTQPEPQPTPDEMGPLSIPRPEQAPPQPSVSTPASPDEVEDYDTEEDNS